MSETTKLLKDFILLSIVTLLITLSLCGFFIVQENTGRMLFG